MNTDKRFMKRWKTKKWYYVTNSYDLLIYHIYNCKDIFFNYYKFLKF